MPEDPFLFNFVVFLIIWFVQAPFAGGLARRFGFIKSTETSLIVGLYWPIFLLGLICWTVFQWIERMVAGDV